jgi:NADPH2:quinone reductase
MRAAVYDHTGPARDVLRVVEIERPEPGPGEVRVRVDVSGVNPTDVKARSGEVPRPIDEFQVPHQDGTGEIDAVGEGVSEKRVGQRVWLWFAAAGRRWGTAAEWTVVPDEQAVLLPPTASDELGAMLGVPAMTAHRCLWVDEPPNGQTVLVAGAAGAVGHFSVELAKWAQARVVATAGGPEQIGRAREAGADLVVDYHAPDVLDRIQAFTPLVDRVVEVALSANLPLDLALSGPNTRIVTYSSFEPEITIRVRECMNHNVDLRFVLVYGVPRPALRAAVHTITVALSEMVLTELPVHRFALDQIAEAHEAVEKGIGGKVLVYLH